ncbi:hypothetical protein FR483_n225R [Paramecium bursaria Chlorella virus FR483]|uniref:Uncharacterized protein n225R n=1 Tax=Paramecium bursaria Chlorella virus FR483 TaxID=399781 RepID=A7J6S9_PBCVF|nr:hypothetical protein FR483_n225R [Paramecium bursaria Chlorella virus FR483]ABT15510.1 hypothetical protein FR483_n225R [Paramecium bursaria Chlorella virus FR483]
MGFPTTKELLSGLKNPVTISGAMNFVVPMRRVRVILSTCSAAPKSPTIQQPSPPIMIFSGLISRWTMSLS